MAYDDGGIWNIVGVVASQGSYVANISDLTNALKPTGNETLVQATYHGENIDFGELRFLVR